MKRTRNLGVLIFAVLTACQPQKAADHEALPPLPQAAIDSIQKAETMAHKATLNALNDSLLTWQRQRKALLVKAAPGAEREIRMKRLQQKIDSANCELGWLEPDEDQPVE